MNTKKYLAILMISIITILSVIGCNSKKEETKEDNTKDITKNENTINNKDIVDNKIISSGRYRESEINLPDEFYANDEICLNFVRTTAGNIEMYSVYRNDKEENIFKKYTLLTDENWKTEYPIWLNNPDANLNLNNSFGHYKVVAGQDSKYYLYYFDDNYTHHIICSEDEESFKSIELEGFTAGAEIGKMEVSKDGMIVLRMTEYIKIFDGKDKSLICELSQIMAETFTIYENTLLVSNGQEILIYDITSSDKVKETIKVDGKYSGSYMGLVYEEGSNIYFSNENGIERTVIGGSLWERIVDSDGGILSNPAYYHDGLYKTGEDEFHALFRDTGNNWKLIKFYYLTNEELNALDEKVLTVYALDNNKTIRNAISNFKTKYPHVKINMTIAAGTEGTLTRSDLIRALNTEVFDGGGGDIIIMDGLPMDSYIEKGILVDISNVIEEIKEDLLPNIIPEIKVNNSIYAFPARIGIPVIAGTNDVMEHSNSLKELAAYAKDSLKPYLENLSYEQLIRGFYELYANDLMTKEGSINNEKLTEFLESVFTIGNLISATEQTDGNGIKSSDISLGMGRTSLAINILNGMNLPGAMSLIGAKNLIKGKYTHVNSTFVPQCILSINKNCKEQELAKEFLKEVLSQDVQKNEFMDGFPVNKKAYDILEKQENSVSFFVSDKGSTDNFSADWPSYEERKGLIDMIKSLDTMAKYDEVILEMIINESVKMFKGLQDVAKTVSAIENNAKIYLAE